MDQQVAQSRSRTWSRPPDQGDACAGAQPALSEIERRRDDVRRAVEADIVPRVTPARAAALQNAMAGPPASSRHEADPIVQPEVASRIKEAEVLHFVRLLLDHAEESRIILHVISVQAGGASLDDIYLHLFQPAARHIGDLWADDSCSFLDVTLAVACMQKLLRAYEPAFQKDSPPGDGLRQALLVPLPGDQHTFGLSMVTEFFRRAGWSVWSASVPSIADIGDAVNGGWFSLVGFTASSAERIDELAAAIKLVRQRSCNPSIGVFVGGPIFVAHPDYVARVGADAFGRDASEALIKAETFVFPAAVC